MSFNDFKAFREQSFWADFEEMQRLDSENPVKVSKLSYQKVKDLIAAKEKQKQCAAELEYEVYFLPHQSNQRRGR